ncbi:hypothetical protein BBK36DRAFT_1195807 [Trichoderma citrinoviride]|uniref:Uncharacterized protein n=1 Tax=Trichoderma citrinoviride TaxID=58853 RepID=A0A2T4BGL8_9HYPO|nr:hypothetical protein BBK36DRAFT_1195807 [Trichoderma citrinoviride]PTB68379.1 hypothetical protein BBK36DRAFT_1195807 [Trichoderma citrinoviride]
MTISEASKFPFSYTHFPKLKSVRFCRDPWLRMGLFEPVPGPTPHLSNGFDFGSHHSELPTYYGLTRQTLST